MTTKELIQQYVTAHADNRWMDASELEALLTEFAEKLKEPASEDLEQATEKAIRWFENIANECDKLTSGNVAHLKAQIKGMAIRSAEYLKKQEPASKLTWQDIQRILGAQWCNEQMMKDAIETTIDGKVVKVIVIDE